MRARDILDIAAAIGAQAVPPEVIETCRWCGVSTVFRCEPIFPLGYRLPAEMACGHCGWNVRQFEPIEDEV